KSGNYQKGKVDLTESVNSLTETTTKITTETTHKRRGKEIVAFYEKCFGRLISTYQLEVLEGYLEDGLNEEIIILAMKESSLNNANNFAYLKAVLDDWLSKGLTTKKKVKSYLEDRKSRYSNKNKGKNELPTNLQNALDLVEQCDVEDENIWEVD
ncbi:DnaD/phage-associated family protein, partial [Orenia metallireducens]